MSSVSSALTAQLLRLGIADADKSVPRDFHLKPAWLTRGMVAVGKSGTGKSHDIRLIASQLMLLNKGHSIVILDRVGEHAEAMKNIANARIYVPGVTMFIPLLWPSDHSIVEDPGEAVEDVLDTLAHYFMTSFRDRITPLQQRVIRENLLAYFKTSLTRDSALSISDFIELLHRYQEFRRFSKGFSESCEALVSRMYPLTVGRVGKAFDERKEGSQLADLFQPGAHVLDLSQLRYEPAKDLVSQLVVKQLYQQARRMKQTTELRQLVVVDEAHHIAPRETEYDGRTFLDLIAIENRKFGQGLLAASTSPSQLSEALLRNSSVRVCHLLDDSKDIDLMLRFMTNRLGSDHYIDDIRNLRIGEALVQVSSPVAVAPTRVRMQSELKHWIPQDVGPN